MDQVKENRKCEVKCGKHKDETIEFIDISTQPNSTNQQNNQITFCNKCLPQSKHQGNLFDIKQIIQNQTIENWPYQQESKNESECNNFVQQIIPQLQQHLIYLCDEFKETIYRIIDLYQKQIISQLSDISQEIQQNQRNTQKTMKNKLSDLLLNNDKFDILENQLRNLISSINLDKQQQTFIPNQNIIHKMNQSKKIPDLINNIYNDIFDNIDKSLKNSTNNINSLLKIYENQESIIEILKIKPTSLMGNQNRIIIQNYQEDIVIQLNPQNNGHQAVSEFIFDKNNYSESQSPMIGLIRKDQANNKQLHNDLLCYCPDTSGLTRVLKGVFLKQIKPKEIELFISFKDDIMQISDYPNHNNVNTFENNNSNLKKFKINNLCLGFSVGDAKKINYVIKQCIVLNENPEWII